MYFFYYCVSLSFISIVTISIESDQRPTISGGPLIDTYEFSQLSFYFSERNETMNTGDELRYGHLMKFFNRMFDAELVRFCVESIL